MKVTAVGLGAIALAVSSAGAAHAGTLWIARMTPAREVPPNNAPFSGNGFLVLNNAETSASVTATHNIPANQLTGGHVHRGAAGVNGPIILPFPNPASPIGPIPWAIPTADVANLKAGNLYMNIHTATFPGGVIRDQFGRVVFANSAATGSQQAVGGALDVSAGFNSDLDQVLFSTAVQSAAGQAAVLQDLSGQTLYAQAREPADIMHSFQETILQHVDAGPPEAEGFGAFGSVGADWGRRNSRDGQIGSDIDRQSILGGVQYAWAPGMAVGAALGYAEGKNKFNDGLGKTRAKTLGLQGFVTGGVSSVQATAVAGYGWSEVDTDRNLPSLARTATSSPDAKTWAVAGRVSTPLTVATNMTVSPYGQIDAQGTRVDSYQETGAGAVGLIVPKQKFNTVAMELGAALAARFGAEDAWTARLQAGWRRQLDDGKDALPLALIGSPVGFVQRIPGAGRDAAHIDASIGGTFGQGWTAEAAYRGLLGDDSVHGIELRFSYAM
ncbi:autotransporter domain-containing protein [Phenylobacterium sp. LjRoot219]|uniref:autotransporter domain-containing protein n=1 Tax=Phenylobacterium sp. LjRoot219 TaxID=3342283 RepID=UPI003ECEE643